MVKPVIMTAFRTAALLTALLVLLSGCGDSSVPSEVRSLVSRAQDAGGAVASYHMSITMSFTGAGSGEVKTEEVNVDVSGDDIRLTDTYFDPATGEGTVIQEKVRAGGRQWNRDLSGGGWTEEEASLDEEAAAIYTAHISEYISNCISARVLGDEVVNGVQATRVSFELSPGNISSLLTEIPPSNLERSTGGQVDIWIDAAAYHPVKYDMVYRDVSLGAGYEGVDVHVVIDITGINQPLEINQPV